MKKSSATYNQNPLIIVIFSVQVWDEQNWTNKQHLAVHFAKAGHKIIFVNPTILNVPSRYHLWGRLRQFLTGKGPFPNTIFLDRKNLWIYQPAIFPLRNKQIIRRLNRYLEEKWNAPHILHFARKIRGASDSPIIALVYPPEITPSIHKQPYDLLAYDCVDNIREFPFYKQNSEARLLLELGEELLLRRAEVVFATAPSLYKHLSVRNPNTHLVPNVADAPFFAQAQQSDLDEPQDLEHIPHPRIGFIGAVTEYKLNIPLILEVARKKPSWHWVLVGNIEKEDNSQKALSGINNIHLLGYRPYRLLPTYLKGFDICAIPYNINKYTNSCFPIKFFEYLASGKPTISTPLSAIAGYRELVPMPEGSAGFIRETEKLLTSDSALARRRRIALAFENTWEKRTNRILELIYERLKELERFQTSVLSTTTPS